MANPHLSAHRLRELLTYLPEDGIFLRRIDPRTDRPSKWKAGTISGAKMVNGYVTVVVDGVRYLAHRLAWFYLYEVWPEQIDHINGVRNDNRITNLRAATNKQNCENKTTSPNSKSGFKGVSFDEQKNKWRARITHNYKEIWLGYYNDAEAAAKAYAAASVRLFTHGAAR